MLAEKFKNQSRRLPGRYTVRTGDSWTRIAEKLYGPLYQDTIKAQKMAEQLARANAKVGTLRPGTVLRVARPRRNPYLTQAFMGDTGQAPAVAPAVQGYTGPVAQAPVAPSVNYNVASTQGRPWATGSPMPTAVAPIQGYTLGPAANTARSSGLPHLPGSDWAAGVINTLFGRNPNQTQNASTWNNPYAPPIQGYTLDQPKVTPNASTWNNPRAPAIQGYTLEPQVQPRNQRQRNRQPGGAEREGNDRGMLATFNENAPRPDWTTGVWEQIANTGKLPLFIWGWDAENAGITPEILGGDGVTTFGLGYWQDPLTGNWILRSGTPAANTSSSSTSGWSGGYSGGYSPGFRGGGGGSGGTRSSGYTGYGSGAQERAQGYPTEAARMVREAGIGLISWRI